MSKPKITIGMTCYNASDSIVPAIESAAAQDWENKELVIVDDCSSDDSVEVVQRAIKEIPYARLVRHERNVGFAGALNTMVAHATGEFVAIFDDDDISQPERLRTQYDRIISYERGTGHDMVVCYATAEKVYPNGYRASIPAIGSRDPVPKGRDMVHFHLYLERPDVFFSGGTPSCSLMARTEVFRRFGQYDTSLRRNEDCDFAVRMGLMGAHFIGTPEVLVRQSPSGGADKRPEVSYESECAFLEKYRDILDQHGRYEFARSWARIKYHHYAGRDVQAIFEFSKLAAAHPVASMRHFLRAAPRRFFHERRMKRRIHAAGP